MLKPEDLRLGNWLYAGKHSKTGQHFFAKVQALNSESQADPKRYAGRGRIEVTINGDDENIYHSDDFRGLPIDDTILEKLGFEKMEIKWGSDYFINIEDNHGFGLYKKHAEKFYWYCFEGYRNNVAYEPRDIKIEFLHELQNLYWSLMREELTIDLDFSDYEIP